MIRRLLTLSLLLLIWLGSSPAMAEAEDYVLYRQAKFGMSVEQVRQSESQADDLSDENLVPADEIWGNFVELCYTSDKLYESPLTTIYYHFLYDPEQPLPVYDGDLVEVLVKVTMPALGESDPVEAYGKFKEMFTDQYGPPKPDEYEPHLLVWVLPDKKIILWHGPITLKGTVVAFSFRHPQDSNETY